MIAANELRIGNWVNYDNTETPFCVTETSETGIGVKNSEEETWIEIDQFYPIPLTSEILEKCGFVRNALVAQHNDIIFYDDHFGIKGMLGVVKPNNINHLHQLQNLFYALTNEELKINL